MIARILKWVVITMVALIGTFMVTNCTMLGLNYASLDTANKPAPYPPIGAETLEQWEASRPELVETFETEVYGPWPEGLAVSFGSVRVVDPDYLDGAGTLEEVEITLGTGEGARRFMLAIAWPKAADPGRTPVMIGQTFSSNCFVFQSADLSLGSGEPCVSGQMTEFGNFLVTTIFGEYIAKVPVERYFARGIAYANYHASDIAPDGRGVAEATMEALRASDGVATDGTLALWGYGYTAAIEYLETDPRTDRDRIAGWGHSRHGKSVLLAGVYEPRLSLIFSHQSGFGGSALSRSDTGERIDRLVEGFSLTPLGPRLPGYAYWFTPRFSSYVDAPATLPVDQHQLVALLAPRPVLLGNGRRDVWSDPNSTYRAAQGADPVWELYGEAGLDQAGMRDFQPGSSLAYFVRSGGHGIVGADYDRLFAFLDAHGFGMTNGADGGRSVSSRQGETLP